MINSGAQIIGSYILEGVIGKGHFATVYLGREIDSNKAFAIKKLKRLDIPQT